MSTQTYEPRPCAMRIRFDSKLIAVGTFGRWLSSILRPPPPLPPPWPPPPPAGLVLVAPPPANAPASLLGPVPVPLPEPTGFVVPASLDLTNLPRRLRTLSLVAAVDRLSRRSFSWWFRALS